jgi:hypothetical protein
MKSEGDLSVWHGLFKISSKIARESKFLVYRELIGYLSRKSLLPDLRILACNAVAERDDVVYWYSIQ